MHTHHRRILITIIIITIVEYLLIIEQQPLIGGLCSSFLVCFLPLGLSRYVIVVTTVIVIAVTRVGVRSFGCAR